MNNALQEQLFTAIDENNPEGVCVALEKGANPNDTSLNGQSAFHACVKLGNDLDLIILDELLHWNGDISTPDANGETALDHALKFEVEKTSFRYNPETNAFDIKENKIEIQPPAKTVIALYERNAKATNHEERIGDIRNAMLEKEGIPLPHWDLKPHLRVMTAKFEKNGDGLEDSLPQKVYASDKLVEDGSEVPHYETPYDPLPACGNNADDPYLPFIKCLNYTGKVTYGLGMLNELPMWHEFMATLGPDWKSAAENLPELDPELHNATQIAQRLGHTLALQAMLRQGHQDLIQDVSQSNVGGIYLNSRNATIHRLFYEGRTPQEALGIAEIVQEHAKELGAAQKALLPEHNGSETGQWNFLEQVVGLSKEEMTTERQQEMFDILTGNHADSPLPESILAPRYADMTADQAMEECGFYDHIRFHEKMLHNEAYQRGEAVDGFAIDDEIQKEKAANKGLYQSPAFAPLKKHQIGEMSEDYVKEWEAKAGTPQLDAEIARLTGEHYKEVASRQQHLKHYRAANAALDRAMEEETAKKGYAEQEDSRRQQAKEGPDELSR